jgi:hypothetical protein
MNKDWKHTGRRAFLRGAGGLAISLPLLEFTHGHAFASGDACKRFLTVFSHGGTISNMSSGGKHDGTDKHHGEDWWRPASAGRDLVLGPIHEPLAAFQGKLTVLEGIDNMAAVEADQYNRGGHGISNVTALTANDTIFETVDGEEEERHGGPSIDFVVADRLAARQPVRFNRIHLNVRGHQYGTPYARDVRQGSGGESDPRLAFETIFEGVTGDSGPDPAFVRRQMRRRSVLDGVMEGFARFRNTVSARDVHVVDAHLEHLRALEREISALEMPAMCLPPDAPTADDRAGGNVVGPLHAQIIVAALRCGLTNVANLEIADITTPWTPTGSPTMPAFDIGHSLGHMAREIGPGGEDEAKYGIWFDEMLDNRRWRISLVQQILEGLDDPTFIEGDGTILDNSLLMMTSEFSDGSGHIAKNVPVLLAGSAGGTVRTGLHIDYNSHAASDPETLSYSTNESTHNLFTTVLRAMGESDDHFGNGDAAHEGVLPDVLV